MQASEHEVVWVMRGAIIVVGAIATYMALKVQSVYGLWYLSSDLVYVILFPQLVCVVHLTKYCNTYGSLAAYIVGLLLRASGGEPAIGLPVFIKYPNYDEIDGQLFPFRTFAMLSSLLTLISISTLMKYLFEHELLPAKFDVLRCLVNIPDDVIKVQEPQEGELTTLNNAIAAKTYQSTVGNEMNGRVNPAMIADETDNGGGDAGPNLTANNVNGGNRCSFKRTQCADFHEKTSEF